MNVGKNTVIRLMIDAGKASVGHAESLAEKTGLSKLTGASPSAANFVREASLSDLFETRSSELAAIRADEPTRAFAAKMNEDHQKSSSELSMIVKPHVKETPLPFHLDGKHQGMVDKLKALDGGAFTKQYRTDQVSAHKDAVSLFQRFADGGKDNALRAFAKKTLPILQAHLKMAQDLTK